MKNDPSTTPDMTHDPHANLGVWGTVKLSLTGKELDFTTGPLSRAILLLSIPMVLEMAMESVFALTDAFFVSRLGTEAVATVGLTEAMVTILFAVAHGLGIGTTAMIARRIGERNKPGARVAAAQALLIGLVVSAAFAIPGFIFARELLSAMGGSSELVVSGFGYTRVIFGGSATIVLLFLLNAVFRGAGDAAIAMRVLWIANLINIVLDPCLIFGLGPFPEMGVTGAAIATTIGRGIGVAVQLYVLFFGGSRIRIVLADLLPRLDVMARLIRLSMGGMLQTLISHSSWLALVWIVGHFGSTAVAGYTIAIRLVIFAILPSWGLSNAAATLVGQNLGADRPDRAERSAWLAGIFNTVFLLGVAVVFVTAAGPLIRLFTTEAAVVAVGISCLRWVSYGYPFYAWGMVMEQAFNGAGDTYTPTVINLFCYWLFQLPLAWALAHNAGFDSTGVFMAIMIAEAALAVVAVIVFRRGKWKKRTV